VPVSVAESTVDIQCSGSNLLIAVQRGLSDGHLDGEDGMGAARGLVHLRLGNLAAGDTFAQAGKDLARLDDGITSPS
jgi:hypothetical protein